MALLDRAKNMILSPKTEWEVVANEPTTIPSLLTGYVVPLAGAAAVAGLIGSLIVRMMFLHIMSPIGIVAALVVAVLQVVAACLSVVAIGYIASMLAPSFNAQKDPIQGTKWAAYAFTPAWVFGLAAIIPVLGGFIALVGSLYALYLFYLGAGPVMRASADKTMMYTIIVIVVAIVVEVILFSVIGAIGAMFAFGALATSGAITTH